MGEWRSEIRDGGVSWEMLSRIFLQSIRATRWPRGFCDLSLAVQRLHDALDSLRAVWV
jgi:hypothetical protein